MVEIIVKTVFSLLDYFSICLSASYYVITITTGFTYLVKSDPVVNNLRHKKFQPKISMIILIAKILTKRIFNDRKWFFPKLNLYGQSAFSDEYNQSSYIISFRPILRIFYTFRLFYELVFQTKIINYYFPLQRELILRNYYIYLTVFLMAKRIKEFNYSNEIET